MAKLWQKNDPIDRLLESFTVGNDPELDLRLVNADCAASMAHARMLRAVGILGAAEVDSLTHALGAIIALRAKGAFTIRREDEDVHTAIENALVAEVGEAGKRIHTGRSRNDQVLAALRLWTRGFIFCFLEAGADLAGRLLAFAQAHAGVPMPGRTHLQVAMPSSVGLWAAAYAEELLDDLALARSVFGIVDCCPLGSAASYGVPLPLDREMVAGLLGFSRVQNNVLYANNSRGKFESMVLGAVEQTALTLSKIAQDLMLFSLPELGYFSLPPELCTGSSIMPQKKNPDGLELVRAKSAAISGAVTALTTTIRALPSGYNRDFQETKGAYFAGCETGLACVRIMSVTIEKLVVNTGRLREALGPEIYATDRALELVAGGTAFRDAYREVGGSLQSLRVMDPDEALRKRTSTGSPGNLRLDIPRATLEELSAWTRSEQARRAAVLRELVGTDLALFEDPLST